MGILLETPNDSTIRVKGLAQQGLGMDDTDSNGPQTIHRFLLRLVSAGVNVLTLLLTLIIGIYYVARWVGFNQFWLISIIGHVLPWFSLPVVILLPVAIIVVYCRFWLPYSLPCSS